MGVRKIIDMRKKMDKVANFPQRAMKYQAEVGSVLNDRLHERGILTRMKMRSPGY